VLLFTFKMLAEGDTVVPAAGMGALTRRLAEGLPAGAVRTGVAVRALELADGRVTGVRLDDGSVMAAGSVVVAGEGPAVAALTGGPAATAPAADSALACTTLYFATPEPPLPGRAIWLAPRSDAPIAHAVTLTEVAPEYATADARHGRHLLAATAVGAQARSPMTHCSGPPSRR
jgi:phytoene dehydrogenase-like protein